MPARTIGFTSAVALSLVLGTGCGALEPLEDDGAQLHVFAAHHATPEGGRFPARGENEKPRVFTTDEGWEVTLLEPYVTIIDVAAYDCYGGGDTLEMYWGPCAEDMRQADLDPITVAGLHLPSGEYCAISVHYGPYNPGPKQSPDEVRHPQPTNADVFGSSIYLRGAAEKEGHDQVQFELRVTGSRWVELDISGIEGGSPMAVEHKESFPKELTVAKSYDRFFDGIDFSSFDQDEVEDGLMDTLEDETRVFLGSEVDVY